MLRDRRRQVIDLQALHAVKHGSTTQTHLFAWAKGRGASVLTHATIHLRIEASGLADGAFAVLCHRTPSLTPSYHDKCYWHPLRSVRRPEWLD